MGYIDYSKSCGSELFLSIPARSPARLHPSTRAQILLHARLRCHRRVPAPQQLLVHPFSAWKTPGAAASGCVCGGGGTGPGAPRSLQQAAACPQWGWGPAAPPRPASPGAPLSASPPPGVTHPPHSPSRSSLCCRGVMVVVWCVWGGVDRAGPHPAAPPSLSRAPGQPEGLLLAALTPPPPPPPVPAPAPAPAARMP